MRKTGWLFLLIVVALTLVAPAGLIASEAPQTAAAPAPAPAPAGGLAEAPADLFRPVEEADVCPVVPPEWVPAEAALCCGRHCSCTCIRLTCSCVC